MDKNIEFNFNEKKLKIFFLVLFLPGLLFVLQEILIPEFFSKPQPKISITGIHKLKKDEVLNFIKGKSGQQIFSIPIAEIEKKLGDHPRIMKSNVSKKVNNNIQIFIEERKATYIINSGDTLYEVDNDFRILSIDDVREENLIILTGEFSPKDGYFSGAVIKEFASSVDRAFTLHPSLKKRISEIELRTDGSVMAYIHYPSHIRANAGISLEIQQVRKLYAALAYFENKNIKAKTLDLRGDDAVFQ